MICDDYAELFELYALGLLEPVDQAAISDHLFTACERCGVALRQAMSLNAAVFAATEMVEPPAHVRRRIIGLVSKPKPSFSYAWIGLAAALACVAFYFGLERQRIAGDLAGTRAALQDEKLARQPIDAAFAFLRDPQTRPASAKGTGNQPRGTYFVNPQTGVLLIASNLPQIDVTKTYQMWAIPKGQAPRPAGLFRPDESGAAIHIQPGAIDPATIAALAITVEPAAGSTAPTTTPFLVTPVEGT